MSSRKDPFSSHGLVTHKGKILMMLRDDIPDINDPNKWGLIGGVHEIGETPEAAFLRECQEEMGVTPKNYRFLMEKPLKDGNLYFVILDDTEASQIQKGDEGQKLEFVTLEELENLELSGKNSKMFLNQYRNTIKKLLDESLE